MEVHYTVPCSLNIGLNFLHGSILNIYAYKSAQKKFWKDIHKWKLPLDGRFHGGVLIFLYSFVLSVCFYNEHGLITYLKQKVKNENF